METTEIQLTPKHRIGYHNPVFIVAEVGSNWTTFDDCIHAIQMAQVCGADAVKFQLFDEPALYGRAVHPGWQPGQLDPAWLPKLKNHADASGIEFMCSAFSPEFVDAVDPYVSVHKVASAELTHKRMLEKLNALGKPVILSTGASGDYDIELALKTLGQVPVCLLYCVSAYPARWHRLEHIDHLRNTFRRLVGFSDHSTDVFTAAAEAIFQHRACVIEKHFNAIEGLVGPDSGHSLTVDEFKYFVKRCRNTVAFESRQSPEEREMYTKHNRRLIATKDLKPGDTLKEGQNFGIYRSLHHDTKALSPWAIDEVNGKAVKNAVKAGEGIGPSDL